MAREGLSINSVTITIIAIAIGLVLVGSLLAPVAADVMSNLIALDGSASSGDGHTWANLVGVTVIVAILGLIIVAINNYTKK
jgi:hypothetical protein